jgi:hypothetical protein
LQTTCPERRVVDHGRVPDRQGSVGLLNGHDNLHIRDPADQQRFREQVEAAAGEFK